MNHCGYIYRDEFIYPNVLGECTVATSSHGPARSVPYEPLCPDEQHGLRPRGKCLGGAEKALLESR